MNASFVCVQVNVKHNETLWMTTLISESTHRIRYFQLSCESSRARRSLSLCSDPLLSPYSGGKAGSAPGFKHSQQAQYDSWGCHASSVKYSQDKISVTSREVVDTKNRQWK